jgi:CRISPR-associated protein Csm3
MAENAHPMLPLRGRVFINGTIEAVTGLHIGGAAGALEIGGVDSPVIRNPLNGQPYIPGSSVRGKMRSLTERYHGSEQNFPINRARGKEVYVHTCQTPEDPPNEEQAFRAWRAEYHGRFQACPVCSVFGVTGDEPVPHPTSLLVRDAFLSDESLKALEKADTDFPLTEIKWEATIDRVTSAATPRQIERVPAGVVFEGFELVYSIYDASGRDHFPVALRALQLVEEDYLGGLGSRGGGKVAFHITEVSARHGKEYALIPFTLEEKPARMTDALLNDISGWVQETFHDAP